MQSGNEALSVDRPLSAMRFASPASVIMRLILGDASQLCGCM